MKYFLLFYTFLFIFSCEKKEQVFEKPVNQETKTKLENLNILTNNSIEIDSTGILAFPLSIGETIERSSLESSFKSEKESSFWNIIFYNTTTGEKHLLSKQKMLISNYETDYSYDSSNKTVNQMDTSSKKFIFYNIITDDYDGNKKLNFEDPTYLFLTDKEGKNLKQISPKNLNIINWKIISKTRKIIFNAQNDSNKNKKFDDTDDVITLEYDLESQKPPVVIFDKNFKNSLIKNFKNNWNQNN